MRLGPLEYIGTLVPTGPLGTLLKTYAVNLSPSLPPEGLTASSGRLCNGEREIIKPLGDYWSLTLKRHQFQETQNVPSGPQVREVFMVSSDQWSFSSDPSCSRSLTPSFGYFLGPRIHNPNRCTQQLA